jgi:hypothetical protein
LTSPKLNWQINIPTSQPLPQKLFSSFSLLSTKFIAAKNYLLTNCSFYIQTFSVKITENKREMYSLALEK